MIILQWLHPPNRKLQGDQGDRKKTEGAPVGEGDGMGKHHNVTTRNEKRRLSGSKELCETAWMVSSGKVEWLHKWIKKVLRKHTQGESEQVEWSGVEAGRAYPGVLVVRGD